MKEKTGSIVGIVLGAVLMSASAYMTVMFYVILALADGLSGEGGGDIGTPLALTIVFALATIGFLVLLVLCSVSLAKINKKEKMAKAQICSGENVETPTETPAE